MLLRDPSQSGRNKSICLQARCLDESNNIENKFRQYLSVMNFIEELAWRGMLHNKTEGVEEALEAGGLVGYIGFDPTAPSLTIGNYVQVMILQLFQKHGHQPIVLMGGATGRIGDPSGKDKERELLTEAKLDENLRHQESQFRSLLDFDHGQNKAMLINNLDFYQEMQVLDFLRDVGKTITVSYMLSKDSVKNRLEKGISFTEFSYQLLQAYDFQCLFEKHNCTLQMGGSDQWGNITSGTEFIRRNTAGKAHAITTPLLTKADGSKFGKSTEGNIWLDEKLTSPYKFYQFWINADDRDIGKFLRYFSVRPCTEIEQLEQEHEEDLRGLKLLLAEELTRRIHGDAQYEAVQNVSQMLFNRQASPEFIQQMNEHSWRAVAAEIPHHKINNSDLEAGIPILELLANSTGIVNSKGDARRAVQGNAVSINKEKINTLDHLVTTSHLMAGKYLMLENGKKNKIVIEAV